VLLKRLRLGLLNGALALLLSACASQPAPQAITNWDSHQLSLARLKAWNLDAKLAISTSDPQGKAFRQSANLNWRQSSDQYTLHLSGPFGQGSTIIEGNEQGVSLAQAGQATLHAATADALLRQTLGYSLPIEALYYWVRGIPSPGAAPDRLGKDENGSLASLEQLGWQLSFSRYTSLEQWPLPGKIVARKGPMRITLIIKQWELL